MRKSPEVGNMRSLYLFRIMTNVLEMSVPVPPKGVGFVSNDKVQSVTYDKVQSVTYDQAEVAGEMMYVDECHHAVWCNLLLGHICLAPDSDSASFGKGLTEAD